MAVTVCLFDSFFSLFFSVDEDNEDDCDDDDDADDNDNKYWLLCCPLTKTLKALAALLCLCYVNNAMKGF